MNIHLENIKKLLQDIDLPEGEKQSLLKAITDADKQWAITDFKLDRTEKVKKTTAILLEETIEELEQKGKAIAIQNHELAIEASLERVRTVAMGMKKKDDILSISEVLFFELRKLGFDNIRNAVIHIFQDDAGYLLDYDFSEFLGGGINHIPYTGNPIIERFMKDIRESEDAFSDIIITGEDLEGWKAFRVQNNEPYDQRLEGISALCYYIYSFGVGSIGISTFETISKEKKEMLKRFRNVFDFAYKRYTDVAQAETQAREAKIELALERVRARTMAMYHSDELAETSSILFQQIKELGFETWSCGFCIWTKDDRAELWMGADSGGLLPPMMIPYKEEATHHDIFEVFSEKKSSHQKIWEGEALEKHYDFLRTIPSASTAIEQLENAGLQLPAKQCYYAGFFKQGYLLLITREPNAALEDLSKRFASVFDLTYTRFLDLQKAEAQTREAEIELALERVRARTMAMQHSDELADASLLLDSQIRALGIQTRGCAFNIYGDGESKEWFSSEMGTMPTYKTPREDVFLHYYEEGLKGEAMFIQTFEGEACVKHYDYLMTVPVMGEALKQLKADGGSFPAQQTDHVTYFKYGYLLFITLEQVPEAHDIFIRFAKVFEQTYTRFLDLQKAEAQAREAVIEASLERVRSKTMAMHNSADVGETAGVMVDELKKLGIETIRCGIGIMHEPGDMEVWTVSTGENKTDVIIGWLDMNMHPMLKGAFQSWRNKNEIYSYELKGADLLEYYNAINHYPGYPIRYDTSLLPKLIYHNEFYFTEGTLFAFSLQQLSVDQAKIFKRFAGVFGQTYRRYLDLQQAEAQVMESQIGMALERVRSRTLAMQKSDELAETAAVLFQQLIHLGIAPHRLYIGIIKDETGNSEFWVTDEDGTKISTAFNSNLNDNPSFLKMLKGWRRDEKSITIDMQGEELIDYFKHLTSLGVPFQDGLAQKRRVQHIAYFSQGFIGIASADDQPEETIVLMERFAAVFNLTYTRFNDLKIAEAHAQQAELDLVAIKDAKQKAEVALTELQSTQKQLVQSEKMASLGELTAGIAHEIQNPLNFVNNFSEVSKELIDEMKMELDNGNMEDAMLIANDIISNLEKINHHGKRADAIVKGMLQHSRTGGAVKEATDINELVDEYIRLCYHGLRAKDKSFNATIHTDFSDTVGKVNIIPQDIGRVVLNLITNAFYAVDEKRKALSTVLTPTAAAYVPTVIVKTSATSPMGGGEALDVLITVSDNGNGIPSSIIDKIFQPFFTTKPTGQGTGLGLSLAYDIVKAHGGELKVDTVQNLGTSFIIQLPESL